MKVSHTKKFALKERKIPNVQLKRLDKMKKCEDVL